jgi:hypothetical protein
MGRPATRPAGLKDGFYIEVRNRKAKQGIKIRRDSKRQMEDAIEEYAKTKDIIIYGEMKKGKWVNSSPKPHVPS